MQKARSVASEFRHTYGYEVPVDYLAARLADQAQVYTQVPRSAFYPAPSSLCMWQAFHGRGVRGAARVHAAAGRGAHPVRH